MTAVPSRCPRQDEGAMAVQREHVQSWRPDATCSYCGSLSQEAFFAAAEAGCELGPTDKNYKVYVDLVEPNPDELRVMSSTISRERPAGEGWIELTPELAAKHKWKPWGVGRMWVTLEPRGPKRFGKFYFQHLDDAGRDKFIALLNAKALNIGMPGYFYALPFFIGRQA